MFQYLIVIKKKEHSTKHRFKIWGTELRRAEHQQPNKMGILRPRDTPSDEQHKDQQPNNLGHNLGHEQHKAP
jgi:hypothetical protein